MKSFIAKNYILLSILVLVVVAGGVYWYLGSSPAPTFSQNTVQKGNVVESVSESGNILAENNAQLSFQEGGQISQVYVSEGATVSAGTVLATLNSAALQTSVEQANANLAGAQAQLSALASGTRPEQLTIDQSSVSSAEQSLSIAVENAYSASDDAVRNQLDNLFSSPQTNNPIFLLTINNNSQAGNNIQSERVVIGVALTQWYAALNATSSNPANLSGMASADLQQIQSYIDNISLVLNNTTPNSNITAAMLAQFKINVSTARAEIQGSISGVSGAQSASIAAQNLLALAQAGATPQSISAQNAVVLQAQAAVSSAQVALNNASLIAPFPGTVQALTAQVGQVVSPGTPVLSLINNTGLKIQTYVSETDVAKIKVGDQANVTVDAYGTGVVFPATVTTIDAAQTQVNGSAAYLVTLHFVTADSRLKDGMTANVDIIAAEHDNVLEVPSKLVITNNTSTFVLVEKNGVATQQQVQVGIVGDNGMTEITSGLNAGDQINNF